MFEATTRTATRAAIGMAHLERARAFTGFLAWLARPLRTSHPPQVGARRWRPSPQVFPADG
ncbi:hypothetical protein [Tropicimonas sp.]|uniref:hypothetical protein n=1 Tax=Tropicimonas sp. TaxID=2067044 RepID=UPI003A89FB5F